MVMVLGDMHNDDQIVYVFVMVVAMAT